MDSLPLPEPGYLSLIWERLQLAHPISGLAGAADHSAILAWFGGGALAAGGGGMLLGGLAISAIAFLPIVAFSAYRSYKEAARVDKQRKKVEESATVNRDNADNLFCLRDSADTLRAEMGNKRSIFAAQFGQLRTEALHLAERAAALANDFAGSLAVRSQPKLAVTAGVKQLAGIA